MFRYRCAGIRRCERGQAVGSWRKEVSKYFLVSDIESGVCCVLRE